MIRSQAEIKNRLFSHKISELFRFGSVGVINTLMDFTVFSIMVYTLSVNIAVSQAVGYGCGVVNSFIMNKSWTFKAGQQKNTTLQFAAFLVINAISLGISSLLIGFFVNHTSISVLMAKLIVTLITQTINYVGYKMVVFK